MTKVKSTGISAFFTPSFFTFGFTQASQFSETAQEFGKDTAEAYFESAMIASEGVQSIGSETYGYAKKSAADATDAAKALLSAKSVNEALQLQSDYLKSWFEGSIKQTNKVADILSTTAKKSSAPIKARGDAFTALLVIKQ